MFELKDSEFGLGHAYPFNGRIGLFQPDRALIVSTQGISSEVKDYFKKVKLSVEIIFIENLDELQEKLEKVIDEIQSELISNIFEGFEVISTINIDSENLYKSIF